MRTKNLKKGARFMARWPNTQFYYWATLIEPVGDEWKLQFDDGTVTLVKKTALYDSPPADAQNQIGRVTRSSPTKNRKRPEEMRKSPARKVRKLFTEEDNVRLGAGLSAVKENASASGAADVCSPPLRRSVSVTRETEDVTHGAAGARSPPVRRSVSVTKETGAASARSSPFRRSVSVTKDTGAAGARSSSYRSVSETEETGTGDINQLPSRASISVTILNENVKGGTADIDPAPSVEVQKESVTRNVTKYTESFLDRDFQRRPLKEGSIGSASLRSSPIRGSDSLFSGRVNVAHGSTDLRSSSFRGSDSLFNERINVARGVTRDAESYADTDFRRRLWKEDFVSFADLCPSPMRGSDSLLNEREKITGDWTNYPVSFVDRDFQRQLMREGSVGTRDINSSPYRSVSVTGENENLTHDTTYTAKFSQKYDKKHLNKYPMEFGGRFGTLVLILLLPLYIMSVFAFKLVPDPSKFEVLFEKQLVLILQVAVGIIMLLFVQAVLTRVPIGTVASGPLTKLGILNMRCNGFFAALLTLILTLSVCYLKKEAAEIAVDVYSEAVVSAMLLGIIFALILYKRAGKLPMSYLNPYGSSGCNWYNFWMGREVTPHIGKYNIKLILHRFSLIIVIALNALIVTKAYLQGVEEEILKSLMVSTILQLWYCAHHLYHEDIYLYSFLALSEGVGYMITVGFMTFPFILAFVTKTILDYRLKASLTETYVALCAYTIGYMLVESSSNRKTRSVRDPATSVWKMKVVPKWSAYIQTKAYVGEIIMYWSLALAAGTTYPGIFLIPSSLTYGVLLRAHREYTRSATYLASEAYSRQ